MPNRFLHESVCVSDTIDALSSDEEVMFYRLLVQCDDFGRFDGRPPVILARCFPLRMGRVTEKHIRQWIVKLQSVGLLWLYVADNHQYLQVTTWEKYQQGRATKSKYPEPPLSDDGQPITSDISGYQVISNVPVSVSVFVSDSSSRKNGAKSSAVKAPQELADMDAILSEWPTYNPSDRFYQQVLENYRDLPLAAEAVKMGEWLRSKRKRRCSTVFVLNWLANAALRAANRPPNGRDDPAARELRGADAVCTWEVVDGG